MSPSAPPRIESLRVKNYRALQDVMLEHITPLTVLLGPNGSGKSTVFDVFAFLAECFSDGLRKAWDRRGRFRELRSRDQEGPIVIELQYRERPGTPLSPITWKSKNRSRAPSSRGSFCAGSAVILPHRFIFSITSTARAKSLPARRRKRTTRASRNHSLGRMC